MDRNEKEEKKESKQDRTPVKLNVNLLGTLGNITQAVKVDKRLAVSHSSKLMSTDRPFTSRESATHETSNSRMNGLAMVRRKLLTESSDQQEKDYFTSTFHKSNDSGFTKEKLFRLTASINKTITLKQKKWLEGNAKDRQFGYLKPEKVFEPKLVSKTFDSSYGKLRKASKTLCSPLSRLPLHQTDPERRPLQ